jgi:hypothetical protein
VRRRGPGCVKRDGAASGEATTRRFTLGVDVIGSRQRDVSLSIDNPNVEASLPDLVGRDYVQQVQHPRDTLRRDEGWCLRKPKHAEGRCDQEEETADTGRRSAGVAPKRSLAANDLMHPLVGQAELLSDLAERRAVSVEGKYSLVIGDAPGLSCVQRAFILLPELFHLLELIHVNIP